MIKKREAYIASFPGLVDPLCHLEKFIPKPPALSPDWKENARRRRKSIFWKPKTVTRENRYGKTEFWFYRIVKRLASERASPCLFRWTIAFIKKKYLLGCCLFSFSFSSFFFSLLIFAYLNDVSMFNLFKPRLVYAPRPTLVFPAHFRVRSIPRGATLYYTDVNGNIEIQFKE